MQITARSGAADDDLRYVPAEELDPDQGRLFATQSGGTMKLRLPLFSAVALLLATTTAAGAAVSGSTAEPADLSTPAAKVRTVTYAGDGVQVQRASGQLDRLKKTSPSFRSFVSHRLDQTWKAGGSLPQCANAPAVRVKRWRSDGFAQVGESVNVTGDTACSGGGANFIYVARKGTWTAPLGTQEGWWCTDLTWLGVPRPISGPSCYSDRGQVTKYKPGPRKHTDAPYAGRLTVATVNDGQPAATDRFASRAVTDALYEDRNEGLTLKLDKCFGSGDPDYAQYLDGARRGCLAESYDSSYRSIYVLRMYPVKKWGRWEARSIRYLAST